MRSVLTIHRLQDLDPGGDESPSKHNQGLLYSVSTSLKHVDSLHLKSLGLMPKKTLFKSDMYTSSSAQGGAGNFKR